MSISVVSLGIDVSKKFLDAYVLPDRRHTRYVNDAKGIRQFLKAIAAMEQPPVYIIVEPSGGYEQLVLKAFQQAGLPISLVNARQIRDYARSKGILAKTDKLDAAVLADYGLTIRPAPSAVASEEQGQLQILMRRRRQLVRYIRQEKTAREHLPDDLGFMAEDHIGLLQEQLEEIDALIASVIESNKDMARRNDILQSCKSIGKATAACLLAHMPELGLIDNRKIAALAGLAPQSRDSGNWRGQRHIGNGRAPVREALYLAALSASRHNPDIKAFYQKKKAEGKSAKLAIIACARKLLLTLNALIRDDRLWQP